MVFAIDPNLHWTEHYVRYGFAVRKGLVSHSFCEEAMARVRQIVKNDRPLREWTTANASVLHNPYFEGATVPDPVLEKVFDQPLLRNAIDELFGGRDRWNLERNYYLFVKPCNPDAKAALAPRGHIDFPGQTVPILYRGFTFQVALADTEPFSGNLTLHPGTHQTIQKILMENPDLQFPNGSHDMPMPEPFEFVAEAGDVVFMHHLIFHSGNESHSKNCMPRIALHGEAFRDQWLAEIDPSCSGLSPWERSLSLNGKYRTDPEVKKINMEKRKQYLDGLRKN